MKFNVWIKIVIVGNVGIYLFVDKVVFYFYGIGMVDYDL